MQPSTVAHRIEQRAAQLAAGVLAASPVVALVSEAYSGRQAAQRTLVASLVGSGLLFGVSYCAFLAAIHGDPVHGERKQGEIAPQSGLKKC